VPRRRHRRGPSTHVGRRLTEHVSCANDVCWHAGICARARRLARRRCRQQVAARNSATGASVSAAASAAHSAPASLWRSWHSHAAALPRRPGARAAARSSGARRTSRQVRPGAPAARARARRLQRAAAASATAFVKAFSADSPTRVALSASCCSTLSRVALVCHDAAERHGGAQHGQPHGAARRRSERARRSRGAGAESRASRPTLTLSCVPPPTSQRPFT
jgi:hypothetical protein